jgi:DegV family protein with EDD domain
MPRIAIVTDTDASLPADLAARYGIRQVPISILFGQEALAAELDIDDARLFERVDREGKLPTTAAPSPGQFLEAYQAAFAAGADAVACFCVSSAISATYTAALAARDLLPERSITVVDTQSVSMVQGFMAIAAAEAAAGGASLTETVAAAEGLRGRSNIFAALATLKYLAMSGRVGHVAAGVANLLSVKPVLTLRNGKLELLERVRTRSKALARVLELTGETLAGRPIERMALLHVNVPGEARAFESQLRAALPCPETITTVSLGAGLSVHTGAGLLGVAFVAGQ